MSEGEDGVEGARGLRRETYEIIIHKGGGVNGLAACSKLLDSDNG